MLKTARPRFRLWPLIAALLMPIGLVLANPGLGASAPAREDAFALVIGNSSYRLAPLKNPENDAKAVARALAASGFRVDKLTNATRTEIERAIIRFGRRLKKTRAVGLFYYAGHAVQLAGRNYLIPLGANIEAVEEIRVESVDLEYILARMAAATNPMNIVILDACRDNPFGFSQRSAPDGLAPVDAPAGSFIAYATAPGKVAADGDGDNGLYTSELIRAMQLPGAKIEDVFKRVRRQVAKRSDGLQVPWESSSLTEDFYFRPPAAEPGPAPESETPKAEIAYWESIRSSSNPAMFQAYLAKYPNGTFAGLVKAKLEELKTPSRQATAPPAAEFQITALEQRMIAERTANIRSRPTVQSPKVGLLALGKPVTVTGKTTIEGSLWYRIARPAGAVGFVYGPLLGQKGWTGFTLDLGPEGLAMLMVAVALGLLLLGFPAAFTFGATALGFALAGSLFELFDLRLLGNIPSRFLGIMIDDVLVAIPLFVFMGLMLVRSGLDAQLLVILKALFGRLRGGLAGSVILAGVLLAAITGYAGTAVGAMGLMFLPLMLGAKYDARLAGGAALAAAGLAQIVPPSITLVLLGGILQSANTDAQRLTGNWQVDPVSVADLFAGVVLPGLVLVALYLGWIAAKALIAPKAAPPLPASQTASAVPLRLLMQSLVAPSILLVTVVGSILGGIASPAEAAGLGAIGATLLASRDKRDVPQTQPAPAPPPAPAPSAERSTAERRSSRPRKKSDSALESILSDFSAMTPKWMHHRGATPAKRAAPAARAESAAAAPKPPQPKASVLEGFVYGSNWTPLVAGFSLLAVLALATFFKIRLPRDLLPDLNLALFGIACSGLAVFCGGFVGCLRRVLFTGALVDAMRQTVVISAMIFVTLLGCAVFVLVFRGFNGDVLIARLLANVPGGPNGALLAVIGSMLVFGLLMDFLGILLILVPISAPIILQMDINPIWFGVMIAITLQTNFLTPPFGFAYSRLRAVEPAWKGAAGARRGILPFLVIQLIGLALIAIFPDLATLLPTLLQN